MRGSVCYKSVVGCYHYCIITLKGCLLLAGGFEVTAMIVSTEE